MISSLKQLNAFFLKNKSTTLSNAILFTSKNIKNFSTFTSPAEALKKLQNNEKLENNENNQKLQNPPSKQSKNPSLNQTPRLPRTSFLPVKAHIHGNSSKPNFSFPFRVQTKIFPTRISKCSFPLRAFPPSNSLEGNFTVEAFQGKTKEQKLTSFEQICQVVQNKQQSKQQGLEEIQSVKILDVRSQNECSEGMIPFAVNIPLQELMEQKGQIFGFKSQEQIEKQLEEKGISKNDKIIVYCEHGFRSTYCFVKLLGIGYKNVSNYFGSYAEFSEKSQASQQ
ncbi:Rhodanese-like domain [Pseudocohnilembus persalinus]|uniref:Rhodanese-like domain n=1 Tax=Pseudocohnilembus persalinus TaxID=266149 RepID=A0A0V0QEA2_PSEPJ|nr:Rhodanese-like domain [Pseudocohnilembus persalinus]|eukprot:KRX00432.1 Rhodanese-like domain [Pseudocohnilembus persalinus]